MYCVDVCVADWVAIFLGGARLDTGRGYGQGVPAGEIGTRCLRMQGSLFVSLSLSLSLSLSIALSLSLYNVYL